MRSAPHLSLSPVQEVPSVPETTILKRLVVPYPESEPISKIPFPVKTLRTIAAARLPGNSRTLLDFFLDQIRIPRTTHR